jgi:hypothetical protein
MKTERFDELFRKKLESLPQRFSETDIDRVLRHVRKNRYPFFRRQLLQGAAFGVMAVAMAGLLVWNLYLQESIPPAPSFNEGSALAETWVQPEIVDPTGEQPPSEVSITANVSPQYKNETPADEPYAKTTAAQTEAAPGYKTPGSTGRQINFPPLTRTPGRTPGQLIVKRESGGIWRLPESREILLSIIQLPDETATGISKTPVNRKKNAKATVKKQNRPATENIASGLLAGIPPTLRTGLGTEFTGNYISSGVSLEWKPGKNWGIETGLQYLMGNPENFRDESEYFDRRQKPFPEAYPGQANPLDHFRNIRLSLTILRMPLGLNYYRELGRDFTLSLGLSTAIDLEVTRDLRFDRRPPSDSLFSPSQSKVPGKPGRFNYLSFHTGLEKRWDRWTIYARPFAAVRLEGPEPENSRIFLGAGIGAKYLLFR